MVAEQQVFHDCDELIAEWLNFVKEVVDSEDLSLGVSWRTLQRNKILRVIKKTLVKVCLVTLTEITEKRNDYERFYEQIADVFKVITEVRASQRVAEQIARCAIPTRHAGDSSCEVYPSGALSTTHRGGVR